MGVSPTPSEGDFDVPSADQSAQVQLSDRVLGVPAPPSKSVDVYSGVARLAGKVWAREVVIEGTKPSVAVVFTHPTSNFLGHYMLNDVALKGYAAVGMCTRYIGNDAALLMENCVLDVNAVVRYLKDEYEHVVLVGNSGGGGLAPLFQSQATKTTITASPGGGGPDLTQFDLVGADALVLLNPHPSRAILRTEWLDPAIEDETKPFERNPDLDIFSGDITPPYSAEFIETYRAAQVARNRRITAWVKEQLADIDARFDGALTDLPFVVHGTTADLRFFDGAIDPSDRELGVTLWGDPKPANYLPSSLGHFTTLRSWLSQWSLDDTLAGPHNMREVDVPVLVIGGTADPTVLPCHLDLLTSNIQHDDWKQVDLPGGTHYFEGQPELVTQVAVEIDDWLVAHDLA
ncbi:MAG: Alpha/beta hydrolase family protein [Aeromicrobium sp.]|nr:Alpha/beta hydrolase family protein [Aeromicrobium sp.]